MSFRPMSLSRAKGHRNVTQSHEYAATMVPQSHERTYVMSLSSIPC